MYLLRIASAIGAVLLASGARAEPPFPQGIWAVGDASACGTAAMFLQARDGAWEFTDMTGETRAQRVVSVAGGDYVTRSASGASWSYHFDTPTAARVTDVARNRSFRIIRCGADSLIGLHAAAQ